jgi:hypothetical protein
MAADGETVAADAATGWRWARAFRQRFYDVVASVYLYNEHTGWQGLERVLEAVKAKMPGETEFINVITKHAADERKHYFLFRRYFQNEGRMPLRVDATFGYVDQFIRLIFRRPIDRLDQAEILADDRQFFRMCRLIMMTEFRGMKQVAALLENRMIRRNPALQKIYRVIEQDEPSHCLPYQKWLEAKGSHQPGFQERVTDFWIHYSMILIKIPLLFLSRRTPRLAEFPA